ncbi:MAG: hypothetical protein WKF94_02270 [Solirubrobacteraceae bacterium]
MNGYLERFGAELDAAAARLVAGERPRRARPLLVAAVGVAVVVAAVIAVTLGGTAREREIAPADPPARGGYAPPRPPTSLRDVTIAFAGNPMSAIHIQGELAQVGWKTKRAGRKDFDDKITRGLLVRYRAGHRDQAALLARTLGAGSIARSDVDEPLVLVAGEDLVFPGAVDAYRSRFSLLGYDGQGISRSGFRLYVLGGSLCITGRSAGGCAPYADALAGDLRLSRSDGDGTASKWGAAPDGVKSVRVRGERVPVVDNVWTTDPAASGGQP